ncbi:uncharacterized protein MCYG_01854 [Microsporum canis CBS 113480]|uniref:Uncharacterized protein n=1 Tax=Arthroderma otae (strain ATCC MYA-4605 / CBS 113480) TaxID=554155 RepID=C5FI55_ARTOC|nr:uncharacterized protein MCYG_01854 [Microsporum canis CBS 113480]EEQ29035.1 predicted protein [Microsporum canis CBS 113480]
MQRNSEAAKKLLISDTGLKGESPSVPRIGAVSRLVRSGPCIDLDTHIGIAKAVERETDTVAATSDDLSWWSLKEKRKREKEKIENQKFEEISKSALGLRNVKYKLTKLLKFHHVPCLFTTKGNQNVYSLLIFWWSNLLQ